jgi:zinc transporter, ZIP family
MSTAEVALLGAIAGSTIFLGLPMGRVETRSATTKTLLNGVSAGILAFLLVDILGHAGSVLEVSLKAAQDGASWGSFAGLSLCYAIGFGVGLMSLLYVGKATRRRGRTSIGPGAMAFAETTVGRRREALALAMSIAAGIGLHNFSEGLAIGQAAHADELSLALLLVVGFGLHNATEGFGIVGPLVAAEVKPTWGWLALAGLVAGGPTFAGTIIGNSISSPYVFVAFLTLAAGAILYVLGELFSVGRKLSWEVTLWGVLIGFLLGLATELIIVAAGA